MRPVTLAQAYERVAAAEAREAMLSEFLDSFYLAPSPEQQLASKSDEPRLTGDERLHALAGAVAVYLAKQYRLPRVSDWAFEQCRYLKRAWHTSPFADAGLREYLTFASRPNSAAAAPSAQRFAVAA